MDAHLVRLFFDREAMPDVEALVGRLEVGALASPFRSTVPLIGLVKDCWDVFQRILSACGLSAAGARVHFEYKVESPRGEGKPSQTDAMICEGASVAAVEAKWTEPRYPTVEARLKRKGSTPEEAREFLNGWLDLLQPYSAAPLKLDDFSAAVYQMVHRAASACAQSKAPRLIYLHFLSTLPRQGHDSHYEPDLRHLHGLLGRPEAFPFYLVELPLAPTDHFKRIQGLKKGLRKTDEAVRAALRDSKLFEFGTPAITVIGGAG